MFLMSVSVRSIVSPPSCSRRKLSFLATFGSIYGFPVMILPLFRSMAFSLSSSLDNVQRICKDVNCSVFGMCQACKTLSCSDCFAKFVLLDVAHLF